MTLSAEQSKVIASPIGISDHAMTGQWRVLIARDNHGTYRAWYYADSDPKQWIAALNRQAERWLSERTTKARA